MSIARLLSLGAGLVLLLSSVAAQAQPEGVAKGPFGIGIIVGEPTGVAAKLYLDDDTAISGAVGSALVTAGPHVHADYLFHPWILADEEAFVLPAYVGPGVRLLVADRGRGSDSDFHLGLRAVAGMNFDFKNIPIDVFLEVAGVVDWVLSDGTGREGIDFNLNAGAGVRYYF